jgi:hypothetical protein
VQVGSQTQISGAVLPFDRDTSEELLKLLRKIAKRAEKEKQESPPRAAHARPP